MKLIDFLNDIQKNEKQVVYYCCKHLLSKKYSIEEDSLEYEELKELFVNYDNFNKSLNDSAGVIYRQYETELNDIYEEICKKFDVDFDNKSLYIYRLARVVNQDPRQFLDIDDKDTQIVVIQKLEDKVNDILKSKYFNDNKDILSKDLESPIKTLELIKSAAGLI